MIGVVLCGGQSKRMGSDKGLLTLHGKAWAQVALEKLEAINLPVVLSINKQQREVYHAHFPATVLVEDNVTLAIGGPLCGLISVHLRYPQEHLLVLGCDMIAMQPEVLQLLHQQFQSHDAAIVVFEKEGFAQPLCGIYASHGLASIYEHLQQQTLERHSMMYALDLLHAVRIDTPLRFAHCFENHNYPIDSTDHVGIASQNVYK